MDLKPRRLKMENNKNEINVEVFCRVMNDMKGTVVSLMCEFIPKRITEVIEARNSTIMWEARVDIY